MELKTLFLGLVMSVVAFAVKTGLGWGHVLSVGGIARRALLSLAMVLGYGIFFFVIYLVVIRVDVLRHYDAFAPLWQNGTLLHWLMALFILVWAIVLLRKREEEPEDACCRGSKDRGWLAMAIPCPVCLTVVLLSESALCLYFPERAAWAVFLLYLAFMGIAAASAALAALGRRAAGVGRREALGLSMLFVAGYFLLFALAAPQFADVRRIYGIASRGGIERGGSDWWETVCIAVCVGVLFISGFVVARWKSRRVS